MNIQKLTWLLERTLYYALLLLTVGAVIISFASDKPVAGLIALILMMAVIHKGFARITIPAKSVVVAGDRVVLFVPEKAVLNRFDIISRGQSIVMLPVYGVFDRPYNLELFIAKGEQVTSCLLTLKLAYGEDLTAWQYAYDSFISYENRFSDAIKSQLRQAASSLTLDTIPEQSDGNHQEFTEPIVTALNSSLASLGVEVKETSCSIETGKMLVRS